MNKIEEKDCSDGLELFEKYMQTKSLCVDVGAFSGKFSNEYCNIFDKVIAFEPNPYMTYPLMQLEKDKTNLCYKNIALGKQTDLVDFHIVTWDKPLNPKQFDDNKWRGISSCNQEHIKQYTANPREQYATSIKVLQMPLDHFDLAPDYIKIDAEGCTTDVLEGAINTITTYKPFIQTDIKRVPLLVDLGYCFLTDYNIDDGLDQFWIHRDYYEETTS